MPSSCYELKTGVAEASFAHCQLPGNWQSRSGLRSGNCRLFSFMFNNRVQVSQRNVFSQFCCFPTGDLSVPTLHEARGGRPAVRFRKDLGSDHVISIRICAVTKIVRPACVSDPPPGRVSADHIAHFVTGSYPPKSGPNAATAYLNVVNENAVYLYIDGFQSHTQYSDHGRDFLCRLVEGTWYLWPSYTVISKQHAFQRYNFVFTACSIAQWDGNIPRTVRW